MTNAMIILLEQVKLHEAGVLNATGKMLEMIDGTEIPEIEPIHTYSHWKKPWLSSEAWRTRCSKISGLEIYKREEKRNVRRRSPG